MMMFSMLAFNSAVKKRINVTVGTSIGKEYGFGVYLFSFERKFNAIAERTGNIPKIIMASENHPSDKIDDMVMMNEISISRSESLSRLVARIRQ